MADETYRRYHAGRYPEYKGGPGQASYAEGSSYGYYKRDENDQPIKSSPDSEIELKALKSLRKALGVTKDGEKGTLGGLRTQKAIEEAQ